jgi:hypothetical protein
MEIEIYGIKYQVILQESEKNNDNGMGRCDTKAGLIKIKSDMPDDIKFGTLIHEVVEAISVENELNLKHSQISILSTGLSSILLRNNIYSYFNLNPPT